MAELHFEKCESLFEVLKDMERDILGCNLGHTRDGQIWNQRRACEASG
jgi:hypothetical protein